MVRNAATTDNADVLLVDLPTLTATGGGLWTVDLLGTIRPRHATAMVLDWNRQGLVIKPIDIEGRWQSEAT